MSSKNKLLLSLFAVLVSSGCTAPKIGKLHTIKQAKTTTTGEVTIIRNNNFYASGVRYYPTIDDKKIAGLYTKEYVHFYLKSGVYTFGASVPNIALGKWHKGKTIEKYIEKNRQYYFLISPTYTSVTFNEIDQQDAEKRISKSRLVSTGTLSDNPDSMVEIMQPVNNILGLKENDQNYTKSSF